MTKSSPYPGLEGLFDLACRDGVDIRPTLLRVLTDLYVQKPAHSAAEESQYVELAARLIDAADPVTRATVVARLASYPGAPVALLDKLADVTGYTITPAAAPLARGTHAEQVARTDGDLVGVFFQAGSDERRLILINLDAAGTGERRAPVANAADLCRRLETAALARNIDEFARLLQSALSIGPDLARRIATDDSGEPILVAARALGMMQVMLQRVLLFINPAIGQSVQRVYELANLYSEITPQAAHAMTDIWRGTTTKRRGAHQGVYWNDERSGARAAATASHARTTRRSDSLAARFKNSGR
jgi:hypothetical protein